MTPLSSDIVLEAGRVFPIVNGTLLIGLISLLIRYWITNRKITLEDNKGLRSEFIAEMHDLRDEVRAGRAENESLRDEVRALRAENESLRVEVRELHVIIDGLRRENLAAQLSGQREIMANMPHSPAIERQLKRLDDLPGGRSGEGT